MKKKDLTQLFEATVNRRAIQKAILEIVLEGENDEALDAWVEDPGNLIPFDIAYILLNTAITEGGLLSEIKKKSKFAIKKIEKFED